MPGIHSAAAATGTPLQGTYFDMPFRIAGEPVGDRSLRPEAGFQAITPGFLQTFGVRLDRGREFTPGDTMNSARVAMVNETFVRRFLGNSNPLSQSLMVEQLRNGALAMGAPVKRRIVGVFRDLQNNEQLGKPNHPEIYVPFAQSPWPQSVVAVRTRIAPQAMMKAVAGAVHSMDQNLPLANVKTMEQIVYDRFGEDRFGTALYGSLAGIALLLASLGIYGVISFTVSQRTSEIGLRMALGATSQNVLLWVLGEGLRMAVSGLFVGLLGAYWVGRTMQSLLYDVDSLDWLSLSAVAALLLFAAVAACYVPARRASVLDPMAALRQE